MHKLIAKDKNGVIVGRIDSHGTILTNTEDLANEPNEAVDHWEIWLDKILVAEITVIR